MKPVNKFSSAFGAAVEKERILRLLSDSDGFELDEIQDILASYGTDASEVRTELLDIFEDLDAIGRPKAEPNRFVDYKAGWYQDLNGNLYQYDGVVWDVVPVKEAGELEFLG